MTGNAILHNTTAPDHHSVSGKIRSHWSLDLLAWRRYTHNYATPSSLIRNDVSACVCRCRTSCSQAQRQLQHQWAHYHSTKRPGA